MKLFRCTKLHLVLALVLAVPVAAISSSATPATASPPAIELLGELELPEAWLPEGREGKPQPLYVDAENGRLYNAVKVLADVYVAEYDITTEVPEPLRISDEPVISSQSLMSSYTVVADEGRGRLLAASATKEPEGNRTVIDVIDLETLERTEQWDFTTILPGFVLGGLSYHPGTDVVYAVGDMSGSQGADYFARQVGARPVSPGPMVLALDGASGALRWLRPLDGCNSVLKAQSIGSLIARSSQRPVLYTFCDGGAIAGNYVSVGQNTLVRIHVDDDANPAEALQFPLDVFPVSGNYAGTSGASGVAGFDPNSERFVAQSIAERTPGGWVFDGLQSAWVGFVAAPDSFNKFIGVDSATGRYYMGAGPGTPGDPGYINVTDVRATPMAQGTLTETTRLRGNVLVDPTSDDRLFVPLEIVDRPADEENSLEFHESVVAMRDNTVAIDPLPPLEPDELTVDLPDDRVRRDVSASAAGYGARYELVGGVESTYARTTSMDLSQMDPSGTARGDRGVTLAPVPRIDARNAGASATAAAASIDDATGSDMSDTSRQIEGDTDDPVMHFPYDVQTCLDAGGGKVEREQDQPPGEARVTCDMESTTATASAAYGEATSGGGVDVARATFDAEATDAEDTGATSTATATAEGIAVRLPDGRRLTVDRVTTVATAVADGRPGTTSAEWTRRVEGVSLVETDGTSASLGECSTTIDAGGQQDQGSCEELSQAIAEALGSRVQILFPLPTTEATPRGAFAEVSKSEELLLNDRTTNNEDDRAIPGMRIIVFNDTAEKSRLLVNLAAVDLTATVIRTEVFTPRPPPDTSGDDGTEGAAAASGASGQTTGPGPTGSAANDGGTSPTVGVPTEGGGAVPIEADSTQPPAVAGDAGGGQDVVAAPAGPSTWLVGTRSLGEAGTAAAVWLLFAWPMFVALRRRHLLTAA